MFQFMGPLFLYFFQKFPNFSFSVSIRVSVKVQVITVKVRFLRFTYHHI